MEFPCFSGKCGAWARECPRTARGLRRRDSCAAGYGCSDLPWRQRCPQESAYGSGRYASLTRSFLTLPKELLGHGVVRAVDLATHSRLEVVGPGEATQRIATVLHDLI